MDSVEWTARLAAVGEERIHRRISYARLSSLLERGKTYVLQMVGHPRGPRIGDLLAAQERAGDELAPDVFHQAFETPGAADPLRQLACNRRRQGLPPSPFLISIAPRILGLAEAGVRPGGNWRSQRGKIQVWEKERFRERERSQGKLEWAVGLGVALLERSKARPAAAFGDLACALAGLAVACRIDGRLDDALDALLLAYPVAMLADDPRVEGIWYQKAGYLLVYLNRCDRAYEWILEASRRFSEAGARHEQAQTLVDIGFVLSSAGLAEEACKALRRALKILPASDCESRFAAHQILAGELVQCGRLAEAARELECAVLLSGDGKLQLASIHWARAKIFVRQRELDQARKTLDLALLLQMLHGSPMDVALIAFELAELLIGKNFRPELAALAAGVSTYIAHRPCDPSVRETIENFVALVTLKELSRPALAKLRARLSQALESVQGLTLTSPQPPGRICHPISGSAKAAELLFGGAILSTGASVKGWPLGGNCQPISEGSASTVAAGSPVKSASK